MNSPTVPQEREQITEADIWRLIAGAFIFGITAGILLTPVIDTFLRTTP